MSKTRSSQKKVSLSELNNHTVNNKRQALKDLKMLNFDELQFKSPAQKRFYNTISKKLWFYLLVDAEMQIYIQVHGVNDAAFFLSTIFLLKNLQILSISCCVHVMFYNYSLY